jgi:hypothetical protein
VGDRVSAIFRNAAFQYREMRQEFELVLEAAYAAAEEGAHGKMLNTLGRSEHVDAYSLMMGPWRRVEKYASPELIEWFQQHPRPSVADYESEWMLNRGEVA